MNLIILGPPGSGKGTQSDFLVKKYNFTHLSTGDLLRDEISNQTEIGQLAKNYVVQGKYIPDDLMNSIVKNKIEGLNTSFILDGYPRTLDQVMFLEKMKQKIDLVIYLNIDEKVVSERLLSRLVCPKCKTTYNKISLPPKVANICDHDQTPLVQRSDDSDEAKIIVRLQQYQVATQPLVNYFEKKGILRIVDANLDSKLIQQQLINFLE